MTRVKRGTISNKHRRSILSQVKGYRLGRKNKERQANEAIAHAGNHAFAHRRDKKNDFRRLWQTRIGAAARDYGMSYSALMGALKKKEIALDRKVLADMAEHNTDTFGRVVEEAKK